MALLQVLVGAVIVAIICAGIVALTMQPALNSANTLDGVRGKLSDEAALSKVQSAWQTGGACASGPDVQCAGSGCSCRCTVSGAQTVDASGPATGPCKLSITSQ